MPALFFYILSFTWGLPITLAGLFCAAAVRLCGFRSDRVGLCRRFRIGRDWGGFSLGMFVFTGVDEPDSTAWHEHGHGLQNCYFGPFMPFLVSFPSVVRYWYRRLRKNKRFRRAYGDVWFEAQATRAGEAQRKRLEIKEHTL